jgi:hypothetical protein
MMKFFRKTYTETSINPLDWKRQLVSALIFTPILLNSFTELVSTLVLVIIGVVCVGILVLLNLEYRDKATIAKVTVAQTVFGLIFLVRVFLLIIIVIENAVYSVTGFGFHIKANPLRIVLAKNGDLVEEKIETDTEMPEPPKNLGDYDIMAESERAAQVDAEIREKHEREEKERQELLAEREKAICGE